MPPATWLNLAIPGAGLLLRGRMALGLTIMFCALITLSALILIQVVATSTALSGWRLVLLSAYVLLAAGATIAHAVLLFERPVDAAALRALHRQIASAHLMNNQTEALAGARRLTTLATQEPGAWRLLALVAEDAGDVRLAAKARRRAAGLDRERER